MSKSDLAMRLLTPLAVGGLLVAAAAVDRADLKRDNCDLYRQGLSGVQYVCDSNQDGIADKTKEVYFSKHSIRLEREPTSDEIAWYDSK